MRFVTLKSIFTKPLDVLKTLDYHAITDFLKKGKYTLNEFVTFINFVLGESSTSEISLLAGKLCMYLADLSILQDVENRYTSQDIARAKGVLRSNEPHSYEEYVKRMHQFKEKNILEFIKWLVKTTKLDPASLEAAVAWSIAVQELTTHYRR